MNETTNSSIGDTITSILNTPFSVYSNETLNIFNTLHFVRADWFYAFIPLIVYLYLYSKKTQNNKNWQSVVDQQLLPFVLTKDNNNKRRLYPLFLILIAGSLCITALAGPVYKKLPQPVYREQSAVVVLLDMSASMNATDIKPSRLSRAKLKLLDILKARKTGQTALIVYAADAFVVTPLTDDNATIANLVPSLETEMMPAQGSNLSLALAKTFSLFSQAGVIKGNILVVTDDIHEKNAPAIERVSSQGHRLSILGIGTTIGGPIPLLDSASGGFLLDKNGAIVIPKLQPKKLQDFALTAGGLYAELKAGDDDVNRLTRLFQSKDIAKSHQQNESDSSSSDSSDKMWADSWQEEGHWLLLPLILFAALWARKGWIAVLLPFTLTFFTAIPQPAYAEANYAETRNIEARVKKNSTENIEQPLIDTENLWSTTDQKAMKAFNAGDNKKAAEHFTQPEWKASALYRNGDYQAAAETLNKTNTSDGFYNKANALAKQGKYPEAIKAYDSAIELGQKNEDAKYNEDARYNREQVKQALEKQQKDSEQNSDEQQQDEQQQNKQQQDNQENNKKQSDSQQKNSDEQDNNDNNNKDDKSKDQQNQNNENSSEQQQPEEKQSEEQKLKQRDAQKEKEQQKEEQQSYDQQQREQEQEKQEQQSDSVENKESEKDDNSDAKDDPLEIEVNPTEASITEEEKATEQWLKRIPDDPGGLLRRKFLYQYSRTPNQTDSDEPW